MQILSSKPVWLALRLWRRVGVRVVLFAVLALATAAMSQSLGAFIPQELANSLGADSVDQVLTILASSMLAVTTFSLSIAVSAYASAASTATPRATALLQEDSTTQNVLATFLGAFVFGLVGIIALKAGYYTQSGTFVLFAATVLVVVLVLISFVRWISHLTDFGRMNDTLDRVEKAAGEALLDRMEAPWLGGRPQTSDSPADAHEVMSETTGYVMHIDMGALSEAVEDIGTEAWIVALPGDFVHTTSPVLRVAGKVDDEQSKRLRKTITCGRNRSFEQDPRFGIIVLTEIASRALSPAVNDPGTAIDVLGRLLRVLTPWRRDVEAVCVYENIHVPTLYADELVDLAMRPIVRDGGDNFEVQAKVQDTLASLAAVDEPTFAKPARRWSRRSLDSAKAANLAASDLDALEGVASRSG